MIGVGERSWCLGACRTAAAAGTAAGTPAVEAAAGSGRHPIRRSIHLARSSCCQVLAGERWEVREVRQTPR